MVGLAGAVGGGSAWHTTVFRASRALWGSAVVALHLGNSLTTATEQSFAWHWVRGGGGSGTMERKPPTMPGASLERG